MPHRALTLCVAGLASQISPSPPLFQPFRPHEVASYVTAKAVLLLRKTGLGISHSPSLI